jgi:hypothetical protein
MLSVNEEESSSVLENQHMNKWMSVNVGDRWSEIAVVVSSHWSVQLSRFGRDIKLAQGIDIVPFFHRLLSYYSSPYIFTSRDLLT